MAGGRTRLPTWLTTTRRSARNISPPPRYGRCSTSTPTASNKPRDGIMERLIPQDPMIIAASSLRCHAHRKYRAQVAGEVDGLAKNDRDQPWATRPPAVDEPSTRPTAIAVSTV